MALEGPPKSYCPPFLVAAATGIVFWLTVPIRLWKAASIEALILSALFGGFVGAVEVANRYRDEPFRATRSPFGFIYVIANAAVSLGAALLIYHYRGSFGSIANDPLAVSIAAGFGAAAVMRSKVVTLKTSNNTEIVVGPDAFVQTALKTIDHHVDRFRAARRLEIAMEALPKIRELGEFPKAASYLSATLLAFQNLDPAIRNTLKELVDSYEAGPEYPEDLKRLALAFIFLTIVGEAQFGAVLERAKGI